MTNNFQVLVVEHDVPSYLFDAGTWDEAIEIIKDYCKQVGIDPSYANGEDQSQSLQDDGTIECGATVVYVVSSESYAEWVGDRQ